MAEMVIGTMILLLNYVILKTLVAAAFLELLH